MDNTPSHAQEDEIDLLALFFALWKKKWIIIFTTILFFAVGVIYVRLSEKIYSSDALIQIDEKSDLGNAFLSEIAPGFESAGMAKHGKETLINTRFILGKTVDTFHLQTQLSRVLPLELSTIKSPPKNVPRSLIDIQLSVPEGYLKLREKPKMKIVLSENGNYQIFFNDALFVKGVSGIREDKEDYSFLVAFDDSLAGRQFYVKKVTRLKAINQLAKRLSISEKKKGSGLYQLKLTGKDPQHMEKLLNNIAENFVMENQLVTREGAQQGIDFIESQLPELYQNLTDSEDKLNRYMKKHGSVSLSVEAKTIVESLADLERQLTDLKLKENALAQMYTKAHPKFKALLKQKASLLARKKSISKKLKKAPTTQQGIIRLKRDVEVSQKIYLQLLMKLQEIKVMAAANSSGVRIIDKAATQDIIVKPKTKIIVLIAGFLGGVISCFFVLISSFLRKVITSPDDVADYTSLPVIGVIPESKRQNNLRNRIRRAKKPLGEQAILAHAGADDLSIEALRGVRTSLHFGLGNAENKIIMISGPTENVGKSFVSVNLAALFAELGKKVVFFDADFRKSYLNRVFIPNEDKLDILDWLESSEQDVNSAIHATSIDNLYTIRQSGKHSNKSSNLVMSERFEHLLQELNRHFDVVILDTPPILPIIDSVILAKYAQLLVLVVKAEQSDMKEVNLTINKLATNHIEVDSVIVNGMKKNKRYGAYYGYGKY